MEAQAFLYAASTYASRARTRTRSTVILQLFKERLIFISVNEMWRNQDQKHQQLIPPRCLGLFKVNDRADSLFEELANSGTAGSG